MLFEEISREYGHFAVPRYRITVDKTDILKKHFLEVSSITFEDSVNKLQSFSIVIDDPKVGSSSRIIDRGIFELGKLVEIELGYENKLRTMITGEIISLRSVFPPSGNPQLIVSGYDLLHQFTRGIKYWSWGKKTDSEVVKTILNNKQVRHKLNPHVTDTKVEHGIVQEDCTDYNFLKKLAENNSFELSIFKNDVYFAPSKGKPSPITTLEYGKTLLSFNCEINTASQVSEVSASGWGVTKKDVIVGKAKDSSKDGINGGRELIEKLYGKVEANYVFGSLSSENEAVTIARAKSNLISKSLFTGNAECIGIPEIRAGSVVLLKGLGDKLSQKYFIENSSHNISDSGYSTSFSVTGDVYKLGKSVR